MERQTLGILIAVALVGAGAIYFSVKNSDAPVVVPQVQNTNVYTDPARTFRFTYPEGYMPENGSGNFDTTWRQGTTVLGQLLTSVHIPRSFLPGTNFSDAKFTVGVSNEPSAIESCQRAEVVNDSVPTLVTIHGTEFTKLVFGDAGAGNFYETTSYRTVRNNACYAIEYTIHSTNIGNYSPEQGIQEFDKTLLTDMLEGMVQSFSFL